MDKEGAKAERWYPGPTRGELPTEGALHTSYTINQTPPCKQKVNIHVG